MHQNNGTGVLISGSVTMSVPAPGFYSIGAFLNAPTLSGGGVIILQVSVPRRPAIVAASSGALATNGVAPVYLEPGDAIGYSVTPNGAGNSASAPWSLGVSVAEASELAS